MTRHQFTAKNVLSRWTRGVTWAATFSRDDCSGPRGGTAFDGKGEAVVRPAPAGYGDQGVSNHSRACCFGQKTVFRPQAFP